MVVVDLGHPRLSDTPTDGDSDADAGGTVSTNGNGQIVTPGYQPRPTSELSSQERSRLLDALIAQHNRLGQVIEAQGRQITAVTNVTDDQLTRESEYNALTGGLNRRLDTIEIDAAVRNSSFMARLRWLLTGR